MIKKNNVVIVGLTILMHFHQYESQEFQNCSGGACPRSSLLRASARAWLNVPTFIIWSRFLKYAPPPPQPIKIPGYGHAYSETQAENLK